MTRPKVSAPSRRSFLETSALAAASFWIGDMACHTWNLPHLGV